MLVGLTVIPRQAGAYALVLDNDLVVLDRMTGVLLNVTSSASLPNDAWLKLRPVLVTSVLIDKKLKSARVTDFTDKARTQRGILPLKQVKTLEKQILTSGDFITFTNLPLGQRFEQILYIQEVRS